EALLDVGLMEVRPAWHRPKFIANAATDRGRPSAVPRRERAPPVAMTVRGTCGGSGPGSGAAPPRRQVGLLLLREGVDLDVHRAELEPCHLGVDRLRHV